MGTKEYFKGKKRIIVKIGSAALHHEATGRLNLGKVERLVRELCDIRNRGLDVCLVSSGAIAVGRKVIGLEERPSDISTKQACAAVGQARLMMTYQKMFSEYHQTAAQILMTKGTMLDNVARKNAQNTFEELFRMGIIPIVNENDTISTYEMQFGDNDTLSALVASLVVLSICNHHIRPGKRGNPCRRELCFHAPSPNVASRASFRHGLDFPIQFIHHLNQPGVRVLMGVVRKQPVNIRQQDQQICAH